MIVNKNQFLNFTDSLNFWRYFSFRNVC